ncbi:MAG TPA: enolase C-terminal domain-like protein [Planctomycetota bacterium]|nr:enolase C-terminal domain-like protein [Planctomycetota bacterium]HRR82371.1 enolase C-terminal domain-like protein [Planctomycetota bacterium]HRT95605.1 enolase C-terminal domain-like protein [Planctomycetota bacterium]
MPKPTDIQPIGCSLFFLPVQTRVPLKFGPETLTHVTCARVRLRVSDAAGHVADGWGETPLSVQWAWPSSLSYEDRHEAMKALCVALTKAWASFDECGHPIETGHAFLESELPNLLKAANQNRSEAMPWLAALICASAFDIALHDAYGHLLGLPTYRAYTPEFMGRDLAAYLETASAQTGRTSPTSLTCPTGPTFLGRFPADFFVPQPPTRLPAWHLVGGKDLLSPDELTGSEPNDGYPVLLPDWIRRDGLKCLKVKLRGNDAAWDYDRLVRVGRLAIEGGALWLTADFNCTVTDPAYVTDILDRLALDQPRVWQMILYVEQPFPYDIERHPIDVHSVSARKPLFMDESAHDWRLVRLGRELGWTGVALKTCKTQTGALLTLCWAKAHGMTLMVQDLTNPMLAQIPHCLLAAHAGTIMGVETNAMQFYPDASRPEEAVHPGLYRRRDGCVDLSTLGGSGFGYRLAEIRRELPEPAASEGG